MKAGKLLLAILYGFTMHFTSVVIDKIKFKAWNRLTSYAIGVTAVQPLAEHIFIDMLSEFVPQTRDYRDTIRNVYRYSYFITYLFFGMGTALGFLFQLLTGIGIDDNKS